MIISDGPDAAETYRHTLVGLRSPFRTDVPLSKWHLTILTLSICQRVSPYQPDPSDP